MQRGWCEEMEMRAVRERYGGTGSNRMRRAGKRERSMASVVGSCALQLVPPGRRDVGHRPPEMTTAVAFSRSRRAIGSAQRDQFA